MVFHSSIQLSLLGEGRPDTREPQKLRLFTKVPKFTFLITVNYTPLSNTHGDLNSAFHRLKPTRIRLKKAI